MKENILRILSFEKLFRRILLKDGKYDLLFFILLLLQISILPAIPSGFHSPNPEGWLGFSITLIFSLFFYPMYYRIRYLSQSSQFIREVVIFSVIARFEAFLITGIVALFQIGLWSFLKLERISNLSLFYYLMYYVVFTFLMILFKNRQNLACAR